MMHGRGKSSPVIVAGKPANKAQPCFTVLSTLEVLERHKRYLREHDGARPIQQR